MEFQDYEVLLHTSNHYIHKCLNRICSNRSYYFDRNLRLKRLLHRKAKVEGITIKLCCKLKAA